MIGCKSWRKDTDMGCDVYLAIRLMLPPRDTNPFKRYAFHLRYPVSNALPNPVHHSIYLPDLDGLSSENSVCQSDSQGCFFAGDLTGDALTGEG